MSRTVYLLLDLYSAMDGKYFYLKSDKYILHFVGALGVTVHTANAIEIISFRKENRQDTFKDDARITFTKGMMIPDLLLHHEDGKKLDADEFHSSLKGIVNVYSDHFSFLIPGGSSINSVSGQFPPFDSISLWHEFDQFGKRSKRKYLRLSSVLSMLYATYKDKYIFEILSLSSLAHRTQADLDYDRGIINLSNIQDMNSVDYGYAYRLNQFFVNLDKEVGIIPILDYTKYDYELIIGDLENTNELFYALAMIIKNPEEYTEDYILEISKDGTYIIKSKPPDENGPKKKMKKIPEEELMAFDIVNNLSHRASRSRNAAIIFNTEKYNINNTIINIMLRMEEYPAKFDDRFWTVFKEVFNEFLKTDNEESVKLLQVQMKTFRYKFGESFFEENPRTYFPPCVRVDKIMTGVFRYFPEIFLGNKTINVKRLKEIINMERDMVLVDNYNKHEHQRHLAIIKILKYLYCLYTKQQCLKLDELEFSDEEALGLAFGLAYWHYNNK